jgi:periplasmic copper chaperone A
MNRGLAAGFGSGISLRGFQQDGTMRLRRILAAALAAAAVAGAAGAHEFTVGALTIGHPYAIATPATARTGAGYLTITNEGEAPDRLVAVRAGFPKVEVHATELGAAGVARMAPVEAVEVGPGETVALEPGGTHVMFMGLTDPFEAGEQIAATLVFEEAGEVAVVFNVEPRKAVEGMDHGAMGH